VLKRSALDDLFVIGKQKEYFRPFTLKELRLKTIIKYDDEITICIVPCNYPISIYLHNLVFITSAEQKIIRNLCTYFNRTKSIEKLQIKLAKEKELKQSIKTRFIKVVVQKLEELTTQISPKVSPLSEVGYNKIKEIRDYLVKFKEVLEKNIKKISPKIQEIQLDLSVFYNTQRITKALGNHINTWEAPINKLIKVLSYALEYNHPFSQYQINRLTKRDFKEVLRPNVLDLNTLNNKSLWGS